MDCSSSVGIGTVSGTGVLVRGEVARTVGSIFLVLKDLREPQEDGEGSLVAVAEGEGGTGISPVITLEVDTC